MSGAPQLAGAEQVQGGAGGEPRGLVGHQPVPLGQRRPNSAADGQPGRGRRPASRPRRRPPSPSSTSSIDLRRLARHDLGRGRAARAGRSSRGGRLSRAGAWVSATIPASRPLTSCWTATRVLRGAELAHGLAGGRVGGRRAGQPARGRGGQGGQAGQRQGRHVAARDRRGRRARAAGRAATRAARCRRSPGTGTSTGPAGAGLPGGPRTRRRRRARPAAPR